MTSREDYYGARWGGRAIACGMEMQPYALWHHEMMHIHLKGSPKNLPQLLVAILICRCQNYDEWEKLTKSRLIKWAVRGWLKWVARKDWRTELEKFLNYQTEGLRMPEQIARKGRELSAPWESRFRVELRGLGYTASEIETLPLKQLYWEYLAMMEMEGRVELVSDFDREMSRLARETGAEKEEQQHT